MPWKQNLPFCLNAERGTIKIMLKIDSNLSSVEYAMPAKGVDGSRKSQGR